MAPIPRIVRRPIHGGSRDIENCPLWAQRRIVRSGVFSGSRRAICSGIIGLRRSNIAHHRCSWPARLRPNGLRVAGHLADGAKGVSRSSAGAQGDSRHFWYVYFLELKNGDIYVGSTNDLRRVRRLERYFTSNRLRQGIFQKALFGNNRIVPAIRQPLHRPIATSSRPGLRAGRWRSRLRTSSRRPLGATGWRPCGL
jgi:GIY-YIG catalytic domain